MNNSSNKIWNEIRSSSISVLNNQSVENIQMALEKISKKCTEIVQRVFEKETKKNVEIIQKVP